MVQLLVGVHEASPTEYDDVGRLERLDEVDTGEIVPDITAGEQEAPGVRLVLSEVRRGGRGGGQDLLDFHGEPCGAEQVGDLGSGPGRGVRGKPERDAASSQLTECRYRAIDRLPAHGEHPVDVDQQPRDVHEPSG